MDIDQIIEVLTTLGDYGTLLSGIGDALSGFVDFVGSVQGLS